MKLNLTYVSRKERTSQAGKPFTSISIKAKEYGEKFLSGFGNADNKGWQAGQEVEVAEVKEVVKEDKTYLNFEMPKKQASDGLGRVYLSLGNLERLVREVVEQNKQIINHLSCNKRLDVTSDGTLVPDFGETPEDDDYWNNLAEDHA